MIEVDVRGLSCPMPVVKTDAALKKVLKGDIKEEVVVLSDAAVSTENVTRLAESKGFTAKVEDVGDGEFRITIEKA